MLDSWLNQVLEVVNETAVKHAQTADTLKEKWQEQLLRWTLDLKGSTTRLPLPTSYHDERFILAGFTCLAATYRVTQSYGEKILDCPLTTFICAAPAILFFIPGGFSLNEICLNPYYVLEKREYSRLVISQLVHKDASHLLGNLSGLIPACIELEVEQSSRGFFWDAVAALVLPPVLYVSVAWLLKNAKVDNHLYYKAFTVGASGAVYALHFISGYMHDYTASQTFTTVRTRRFDWGQQFLLNCIVIPEASLCGHLCGAASGFLYVQLIKPVLHALGWIPGVQVRCVNAGANRQQPQQRRSWLSDLLVHSAIAGLGVVICLALRRQQ